MGTLIALFVVFVVIVAVLQKRRMRLINANAEGTLKLEERNELIERELAGTIADGEKKRLAEDRKERETWIPEIQGFSMLLTGPAVLGTLAFASIALMHFEFMFGLFALLVVLWWAWNGLHEVKEPEMAVLFAFGALKYRLQEGWYLLLIPFQELEKETTSRQTLYANPDGTPNEQAEEVNVYYTEKKKNDEKSPLRQIPAKVRMRVFYRLISPKDAVKMYGGLNERAFKNDLSSTSQSKLRAAIGKSDLNTLLEGKQILEDEIAVAINYELNGEPDQKGDFGVMRQKAPSGYVVGSIDLHFFEENVKSKASAVREQGDADAYRIRQAVEASAEPLKGNPEAAQVNVAEIWANTVQKVAPDFVGAIGKAFQGGGSKSEKKDEKKGEKKKDENSDEVRVSKKKLQQLVDSL